MSPDNQGVYSEQKHVPQFIVSFSGNNNIEEEEEWFLATHSHCVLFYSHPLLVCLSVCPEGICTPCPLSLSLSILSCVCVLQSILLLYKYLTSTVTIMPHFLYDQVCRTSLIVVVLFSIKDSLQSHNSRVRSKLLLALLLSCCAFPARVENTPDRSGVTKKDFPQSPYLARYISYTLIALQALPSIHS